MTSTADGGKNQPYCIVCGEPSTTNCQQCIGGLDTNGDAVAPTPYCGEKCQTAHAGEHQEQCKIANNLKQLYRAGEFIQAHFFETRRAAFEHPLGNIRRIGGGKLSFFTMGRIPDFEGLFDLGARDFQWDDEKKIVVSWMSGLDAMSTFANMIELALQGTDAELECLHVGIRPETRRMIMFPAEEDQKSAKIPQWAIRAKVANAQYAIDLAGAAYGQFRPVLPWGTWAQKLMTETIDVLSFSKGKRVGQEHIDEQVNRWVTYQALDRKSNGSLTRGTPTEAEFIESQALPCLSAEIYGTRVNEVVDTWLAEQEQSLAELLNLEQQRYTKMLQARSKKVWQNLSALRAEVDAKGDVHAYVQNVQPAWFKRHIRMSEEWIAQRSR